MGIFHCYVCLPECTIHMTGPRNLTYIPPNGKRKIVFKERLCIKGYVSSLQSSYIWLIFMVHVGLYLFISYISKRLITLECIHGQQSSHFVETYGISIFWIQWNTPLQKTTFYLTLLPSTKTQPFSDKSCDYILPHQSAQRWSTYHNLRGNSQQKLNKKNSEHLLVFSCKNQQCTKWTASTSFATCFSSCTYWLHATILFDIFHMRMFRSSDSTPLHPIICCRPSSRTHSSQPSVISKHLAMKVEPHCLPLAGCWGQVHISKKKAFRISFSRLEKKRIYASENLSST